MKRILFVIVLSLAPFVLLGQVKSINDILDKYEKKKNVESIMVSPELLQLAGSSETNESTKQLLSKLSELRILSVKALAVENGIKLSQLLREDLDKMIVAEKMSRILRVQDGNELMEMYKTKATKGALLFLTTSANEFTVISIFGEIDPSVVNAAISGEIGIK